LDEITSGTYFDVRLENMAAGALAAAVDFSVTAPVRATATLRTSSVEATRGGLN
jgi:hypothetical protein